MIGPARRLAPWIVALFCLAPPVAAQEEPSFGALARDVRAKLEKMREILKTREADLGRRLAILDRLVGSAATIARSATRTGRDEGLAAIEEARDKVRSEPPIEGAIEAALDRAEVELRRELIGELPGATAARFIAEFIPFETETNDLLANYLNEAAAVRSLVDGLDQLGTAQIQNATLALRQLYQQQGRTLSLQEIRRN